MKINPVPYMDPALVGWLMVGGVVLAIVGVVAAIASFVWLMDGDEFLPAALITALAGLGLAATAFTFFGIGLNTNNNRLYAALQQQAQQRYGLALTHNQAEDLLYTPALDLQEQGDTLVLLGASDGRQTAAKVTLYHIGDTWLLGRGENVRQIDELSVRR